MTDLSSSLSRCSGIEQRVLSSRSSSRRTEAFNCWRVRMRKCRSCSAGASTRRSKSNACAPVIGFSWSIIDRSGTQINTERNPDFYPCNRRLRVDVLGEVPLGVDVALLRTLGFLSVEVPRDVVVVHGYGLDGFVATATANRYRRKHDVLQRVLDQRYHRALVVTAHDHFDTLKVVAFATCFI